MATDTFRYRPPGQGRPEGQRVADDAALVFGDQHERAVGGEAAGKLGEAPIVAGEPLGELRGGKVERLRQLLERGNRPDHVAHRRFVAHAPDRITPIIGTARTDRPGEPSPPGSGPARGLGVELGSGPGRWPASPRTAWERFGVVQDGTKFRRWRGSPVA